MRAVIQRVSSASVSIGDRVCGRIGNGIAVLLGVEKGDSAEEAELLATKISKIRIFSDENGKMNLSASDTGGSFLVVSNFTLIADYSKGNRPSFFGAEEPEKAEFLYRYFCEFLRNTGFHVETGVFGVDMLVSIANDGPVTLVLESAALKKKK